MRSEVFRLKMAGERVKEVVEGTFIPPSTRI
jgi:hypothetical protein